jgi:hypothetical protein
VALTCGAREARAVVPTPFYNHTILMDGALQAHTALIHRILGTCPSYAALNGRTRAQLHEEPD